MSPPVHASIPESEPLPGKSAWCVAERESITFTSVTASIFQESALHPDVLFTARREQRAAPELLSRFFKYAKIKPHERSKMLFFPLLLYHLFWGGK